MFASNAPAITVSVFLVSVILLTNHKIQALAPTMMASGGSTKNVVVIGGGIQGVSTAYHLAKRGGNKVTLLEAKATASAASGKGGGFMARSWGEGSPTQRLHELAFDMYETMAKELKCESYRKLPVLSVSAGYRKGITQAKKNPQLSSILPDWLDGEEYGRISPLGLGDDTAQITPNEFVDKMLADAPEIEVILGSCTGMETDQGTERGNRKVTGVKYLPRGDQSFEEKILPADAVVVSAGPWSCAAEDWFLGAVQLPMEGVKSTSIVWKKPEGKDVDATALFCGEDNRFSTHLEVYPRPDGTIYICGIGGSDYISTEQLKQGAFLEDCQAKEDRVEAAKSSFQQMSSAYRTDGELEKTQACMRPCPPDAMPYMGSIPGYEGAYINAGHNCWGIAWAPACGKAMSELVMDGESKSVNLAPFNPSRFTPSAQRGTRGRKMKGASVGEQW